MATGDNFSISLIEASNEINDLCTPCAENSESKEAHKFCKDCEQSLCKECLQHHNKFSKMRAHVVIDISEQASTRQMHLVGAKEKILKCVEHHGNDLIKFCENHDEVCCQKCIELKHRSCSKPIDIRLAARGIKCRDEYKNKVSALSEVLSSIKEERVKRYGNSKSLDMEKVKILNDVKVYQGDLHAKINDLASNSNELISKKYKDAELNAKTDILKLDSVITSSKQTLQIMATENDVVAFVCMKTHMKDIKECQTILQDMGIQTDRNSLALTLKKDILQTLNEHQTLLTEEIETKLTQEVTEMSIIAEEDVEKWILIDEVEEMKTVLQEFPSENLSDVLRKNLDRWKDETLNIAVTGMSGKGKSSLINTLRNIKAGEEGAAPVGENECTTQCMAYPHPKYNMFIFWDVPGVGTTGFPEETYLKQIEVDRYDFFLIVLSDRVFKSDSWLAQEIQRQHKRFYFVRTKIDQDLYNIKLRQKDKFEEKKEFDTLKNATRDLLVKNVGSSQFFLYMISNHHPNKYEFSDLLNQLLIDVPKTKKLEMVFGIAGMSETIIEEKASALRSRIWKCALMSGAAAILPIPFISHIIDFPIILEELLFYRKQFALDDDSLTHLADLADTSLKELKANVQLKTPEYLFTIEGFALCVETGPFKMDESLRYTIPVIGGVICCGFSYAHTMEFLQCILEMMKKDAIAVLGFVTGKQTAV